jgi:8-oxo-dGTP pyrophosphatase MutT (NUDIX family)
MRMKPVRPVDAAGLVLMRGAPDKPEVLMGRRHRRASFLPGIYVFPGGRVDAGDLAPSGYPERIGSGLASQLAIGHRRRNPMPLLRAAIRETFEETGLLLTGPDHAAPAREPANPVWRAFADAGRRPAFEGMDYICRAITPTASPKRFNTRFFLARDTEMAGSLAGDGELVDLAWRPVEAMWDMALVDVTEYVLREALKRWTERVSIGARPAALFCYVGETARVLGRGAPGRSDTGGPPHA